MSPACFAASFVVRVTSSWYFLAAAGPSRSLPRIVTVYFMRSSFPRAPAILARLPCDFLVTMRVSICGRLVIESGEHVVDEAALPGRLGRRLWAYLVLNRRRPVGRGEHIAALWGAAEPDAADASLNALVSRIRGALPPPRAGPAGRGQPGAGGARDGGVPARAGRLGGRTVGGDPARVPGGQRSRLTSSAEYVETEYGTRYVSAILPATRAVNIPLTTTSSWLITKRIVPTTAATRSARSRTLG